MDQPEAQRRAIFPRQDPWDTAPDSTMHRPFGHYAAIPARPPPFIPSDVDMTNEVQGKARAAEDWMRQSIVPSLPAVGPAFYGRDSKPENYYLNPLAKHSPFALPMSLLSLNTLPKLRSATFSKKRLRHQLTNKGQLHAIAANRKAGRSNNAEAERKKIYSLLEIRSQSTGNSFWKHVNNHASLARFQSVRSKLKVAAPPNDLGGFDGGEAGFKNTKFIIPPVAINKNLGGTPPALAVLGEVKKGQSDQMVAPRVQQFVGMMNWQKEMKDGKPLLVRPYAKDQPSAYQQQPLWPPAPPEPLFPLKSQDDERRR